MGSDHLQRCRAVVTTQAKPDQAGVVADNKVFSRRQLVPDFLFIQVRETILRKQPGRRGNRMKGGGRGADIVDERGDVLSLLHKKTFFAPAEAALLDVLSASTMRYNVFTLKFINNLLSLLFSL
jgi:hypothetical protein